MTRAITFTFALVLSGSIIAAADMGDDRGAPANAGPPAILAQGPPQPPQGRFQLLPASPEPPEIKAQQQEAEQAMKGINQGRLSKQQLRQMLLNHPNPNIRAKAQQAAKRAQGTLRQATPEPPEIKAQMQEAENALKGINQGRLSPEQRRQMLLNHPNPRIREKAHEAQRLRMQPRSGLDSQGSFASLSSLWALLNPFAATEAQAQQGYSITLTPQARSSANPYAFLNLNGVVTYGGSPGFSTYALSNSSSSTLGYTITKPYAFVYVNLPSAGWYLIDFYGYGKPKATLRKSGSVLESWDFTGSPTLYNHFATAEYLAAGSHSFYFTIDQSYLYFYEVSVEAF